MMTLALTGRSGALKREARWSALPPCAATKAARRSSRKTSVPIKVERAGRAPNIRVAKELAPKTLANLSDERKSKSRSSTARASKSSPPSNEQNRRRSQRVANTEDQGAGQGPE
jgi:hypothetical protein